MMNFAVCFNVIGFIVVYFVNESRQNDVVSRNKTDFVIENLELKPTDKYFDEAEEFGIQEMNKLYDIEEPKLFSNGLYLTDEHPARYVAAFNSQSNDAKNLAKLAYAALKGSRKLVEKFGNSSKTFLRTISQNSGNRKGGVGFRERCKRKDSPSCPPMSRKYRTIDGSCNNLEHLWWGSAMSTMQRFLEPFYDDEIESIRKSVTQNALPSPRDISAVIHSDRDVPLASVTHMLMQWGQFIDHDMTATAQSRGFNGTFPQCCRNRGTEFQPPELMHPDCLPIVVDRRDNFFGKLGVRCLEFVRSGPAPREDCGFGPREQLSQVTSFLDASMVYSSNALHSDSLRMFRNGLLQYGKIEAQKPVSRKGEPDDLCRRGSLSSNCFRAGDARLSEQPALTSLHVVFLRLHNRIATELGTINPHWTDEKLFQESRKIIGAVVQHITYKEYLPIVLGPEVMKIFDLELTKNNYYEGYDPRVNPTVANSFSAAAYRFGHSLVQHNFARYDKHHHLISDNVTIHGEFNNRMDLQSAGSVDRLLLGLINQVSQRRDEFITKELTNHLFQFPGFPFGMDLAAINIQRGRDHGLAPYVEWRKACGLSSIVSWLDMERVTTPEIAHKFRAIYENVDDIDLFSAGLAEKPVVGGLVGPTFACIIAQHFSNLRIGDRFWYENPHKDNAFTLRQLKQIKRITFARILCKTLDNIETIQPFVFLTADTLRNSRVSCNDRRRLNELNLDDWSDRTQKSTEQTKTFTWLKPVKTNVNQKNRIVVKKPFGQNENVTIVVQNYAVNSPVFVSDSIYGSHFKISSPQSSEVPENYPTETKPTPTKTKLDHYTDNDDVTKNPVSGYVSSSTVPQSFKFNDWIINSNEPGELAWLNSYPMNSSFVNGNDSSRSHSNKNNIARPLVTQDKKLLPIKVIAGNQDEDFESLSVIQEYIEILKKHNYLNTDEFPRPILKRPL